MRRKTGQTKNLYTLGGTKKGRQSEPYTYLWDVFPKCYQSTVLLLFLENFAIHCKRSERLRIWNLTRWVRSWRKNIQKDVVSLSCRLLICKGSERHSISDFTLNQGGQSTQTFCVIICWLNSSLFSRRRNQDRDP